LHNKWIWGEDKKKVLTIEQYSKKKHFPYFLKSGKCVISVKPCGLYYLFNDAATC